MNESEIQRIRRFALFSSALLLFYVLTGMGLKNNELNILNNSFSFDKGWIIPFLIAGFSLYGIMKFFYYGIIASPHPRKARKILQNGRVPAEGWDDVQSEGGAQKAEFDIKRRQMFIQQATKYFPGIKLTEHGDLPKEISRSTKLKSFIYDIDFYAPIWVGILSIGYFLISYFC